MVTWVFLVLQSNKWTNYDCDFCSIGASGVRKLCWIVDLQTQLLIHVPHTYETAQLWKGLRVHGAMEQIQIRSEKDNSCYFSCLIFANYYHTNPISDQHDYRSCTEDQIRDQIIQIQISFVRHNIISENWIFKSPRLRYNRHFFNVDAHLWDEGDQLRWGRGGRGDCCMCDTLFALSLYVRIHNII